ncbi:MAG: hypothetical protein M0P99_07580, partial [Candidatus Cloacimonetes bacterium]|nr:hypothetical protein [Candidatus Cloacimonadota bacterium]
MKIITIYNNDLLEPLLDKMAKLTTEGFGDSVELWRKRFAYWWKDNPYLTDDMPACWIISNDEMDEIFGFHASIPILFQHGDKKLLAAGSGTFYVTPSARGALSTALGIQPSRHKYVDVMISTTTNALSHKMICSMGYRRVGNMDTITNYMIIVCCRDFLSMISYLANHFMISETGM